MSKQNGVASSIMYKSMERYSTMAFQLIVQIVIARILSPSDFGIVAMMTVFINVAGVFIYNGFNMAVIQKKNADEKDFSTALIINIIIGVTLYLLIYVTSPAIAYFYKENDLTICLRVLALILPIGSVYSIQSAILSRNMRYDTLFVCNLGGSILSGLLGVVSAIMGMGFWALIIQQMSNIIIATLLILIKSDIRLRFAFVAKSAKEMFDFGWKLLVAGLINVIYNELNSLVIGKKYTSSDLAFYTKGKTFPTALASGVDSALQSVILSALSRKQEDYEALRSLMRKSMIVNTYVIMPAMAFMAIIAKPLTLLLLTEKWLPMVPFMQIICLTVAFHPIGTISTQALAAAGYSDIRLKMEFIKKPIGLLLLLVSLKYGPLAIAISAAVTSLISFFIGIVACQIYLHYPLISVFKEIFPSLLLSLFTGFVSLWFVFINISSILIIIIQGLLFFTLYILLSKFFSLEGYGIIHNRIKDIYRKKIFRS